MWFVFILVGIASGILGSMGLGGGTILIPILTLIGVTQKTAQVVNVFSFVCVAFFILFFYIKKGYTQVFPAVCFSFFAVISATLTALLVQQTPSNVIRILFAIFLLLVAVFELIAFIKKYGNKNKN
jgi:uncharacterized membrane protein YfcA